MKPIFVLALLMVFVGGVVNAAENVIPTEICNVSGYINTFIGKGGLLDGCREGDVVHFQIDKNKVSPASVTARYCDFNYQIIFDTIPNNSVIHLVCKYKWKWAKNVVIKKHLDAK